MDTAGGWPRATRTIVDAVLDLAPSAEVATQVNVYSTPVSSVNSVSAQSVHSPPESDDPVSSLAEQGRPPSVVQLMAYVRAESG